MGPLTLVPVPGRGVPTMATGPYPGDPSRPNAPGLGAAPAACPTPPADPPPSDCARMPFELLK